MLWLLLSSLLPTIHGAIALFSTCFAGQYTAVPMPTAVNVSANMGLAAKRDRLCIRCIVQDLQTHLEFQQMICWKLQLLDMSFRCEGRLLASHPNKAANPACLAIFVESLPGKAGRTLAVEGLSEFAELPAVSPDAAQSP